MKFCTKCGEQIANRETVCPSCGYELNDRKASKSKKRTDSYPMIYCTKCGGRVSRKSIFCPYCGCFSLGKKTLKNPNDKINLGLCLVAFLFPPFGLIYWPVMHKEVPEKAQAVGVMSVISLAIYFAMANGLFSLFI